MARFAKRLGLRRSLRQKSRASASSIGHGGAPAITAELGDGPLKGRIVEPRPWKAGRRRRSTSTGRTAAGAATASPSRDRRGRPPRTRSCTRSKHRERVRRWWGRRSGVGRDGRGIAGRTGVATGGRCGHGPRPGAEEPLAPEAVDPHDCDVAERAGCAGGGEQDPGRCRRGGPVRAEDQDCRARPRRSARREAGRGQPSRSARRSRRTRSRRRRPREA